MEYFEDEYRAHIEEHRCPAGVCKALVSYSIDAEKCNGCTLCATNCPAEAVTGEKQKLHTIDDETCTRCGICYEVCNQDAVVRT
jgi:Pyruvate/2-oxoacid:ferredoxin oxidoreductase delta subunit